MNYCDLLVLVYGMIKSDRRKMLVRYPTDSEFRKTPILCLLGIYHPNKIFIYLTVFKTKKEKSIKRKFENFKVKLVIFYENALFLFL